MTPERATGSTGSDRVQPGSWTQSEPTGSTGSTGVLQDPVTRDPVTGVSRAQPGPSGSTDLGDRLRRLALWADRTPQVHRVAVAVAIDRLATLLGMALNGRDDQ